MSDPGAALLHANLRALLMRELNAGEQILWCGMPRRSAMASAFVIWLFAIPWTVFALVWEAMAWTPWFAAHGAMPSTGQMALGIALPLFGLPFIAIGVWMLALPVRAVIKARRTLFAVTDHRLIRLCCDQTPHLAPALGRAIDLESVTFDRIGAIKLSARRDGVGNVRVQTGSHVDSDGDHITEWFEMIGIPDAAQVPRLIGHYQRA
ncbi:MAG: PH domain-containing protein [Sphingomonas sp.]|nr:PH domain-containing protein [Sphingomonas sp.]